MLKSDLLAKSEYLFSSHSATALFKTLFADGTSAVLLFRSSEWMYRHKLFPLGLAFSKLNSLINGVLFGRGANISEQFIIQHPIGVIINGKAIIGKHCVIQSHVTIGSEKRKSPIIGDNVSIGSGAKIIGDVHIGNNVKIGANAVIIKDIPNNSTAVGVPARIISR